VATLAAAEELRRIGDRGHRLLGEGVDAVDAGRDLTELAAWAARDVLLRLPGEVALLADHIARIGGGADAVGVALGIATDVAVPTVVVPGKAGGYVHGRLPHNQNLDQTQMRNPGAQGCAAP